MKLISVMNSRDQIVFGLVLRNLNAFLGTENIAEVKFLGWEGLKR